MFRKIALTAMLVCGLGTSARADITIDTFLDSGGGTNYLVGMVNPLVLPAVVLPSGFTRTTTITVVNPIPPDFNSIGGTIGAGDFSVDINNSTLGFATLAYATGSADFSMGTGVRLDFINLNPGNTSTVVALDMPIMVTINTTSGTLSSSTNVAGSGAPFPVNLPFASFTGTGNLSNVTGLSIQLNGGPNSRFAADFVLDTVSIPTNVIPAPPAIVLAGLAAPVLLLRRWANRKAA